MGLQHRFVTAEQVENGDFARAGYRVLILPHAISLSARAAEEIRNFVKHGGAVLADGEPGLFDEHGRRLKTPALADLFPHPAFRVATRVGFGQGQAIYLAAPGSQDRDGKKHLRNIFAGAGIEPLVSLVRGNGQPADDVETYIFNDGGVTIVALLRDLDASAAAPPPEPEAVNLELPRAYEVYDVRAQRGLGLTSRLKIDLGSVGPVVLALSQQPLPVPSIAGPPSVHAGDSAEFRISPNGNHAAALDVIHVEVADPDGNVPSHYGGNLLAPAGVVSYWLPLAVNDKAGVWTLRATSLLRGASATWDLHVEH
jgi:catechol 2,3-dioxygenase-like lactoylglutathione lyase family enzyme